VHSMTRLFALVTLLFCISITFGCASIQKEWERARIIDSISSYKKFINDHPKTEYVPAAEQRIQEIRYQIACSLDTEAGYIEFLNYHENGVLADSVKYQRLEGLISDRAMRSSDPEDCDYYLGFIPDGEHATEISLRKKDLETIRDRKIFEALSQDTVITLIVTPENETTRSYFRKILELTQYRIIDSDSPTDSGCNYYITCNWYPTSDLYTYLDNSYRLYTGGSIQGTYEISNKSGNKYSAEYLENMPIHNIFTRTWYHYKDDHDAKSPENLFKDLIDKYSVREACLEPALESENVIKPLITAMHEMYGIEPMLNALDHPVESVRDITLDILVQYKYTEELFQRFVAQIKRREITVDDTIENGSITYSNMPDYDSMSGNGLERIGSEAVPMLLGLLDSKHPDEIVPAMAVLSRIGDYTSLRPMLELVNHTNHYVSRNAAYFVLRFGQDQYSVIDSLLCLADRSREMVDPVVRTLSSSYDLFDFSWAEKFIQNGLPDVRAYGAWLLADILPYKEKRIERLISLIRDDNAEIVRKQACVSLEWIVSDGKKRSEKEWLEWWETGSLDKN